MKTPEHPENGVNPFPGADRTDERASLAASELARLGRALSRWARVRPGAAASRARRFLGALPAEAAASGPVRCFVSAVEEALSLVETSRGGSLSRLVDLVADAGVLADLAPEGSIPTRFRRGVGAYADARLGRLAEEAPLLAFPWLAPASRPRQTRVSFAPDADLGRPANELEMPAAAVRFERKDAATLVLRRADAFPVVTTGPSTGAVLRTKGSRVEVGTRDPRFDTRVARALELLDLVWPDAAEEVRALAWRVVPVTDRAIVSYSSLRRPGILYVHVRSAPLLRLAEDLLHETVHVRVHTIETLRPLVVPRGPDGEEPRDWSPWRLEWRPVRGLLHGACTFTAGAEYFERALRAVDERSLSVSPARRLWLARRLLEECASVTIALRSLRRAAREGVLTPAGREVVEAVGKRRAALGRAAAVRRKNLEATAKGRGHLRLLSEWRDEMRRRPLRWN